MNRSVFHTVLVIGENPDKQMELYSGSLCVDLYLKYKRKDAGKLRKKTVEIYKSILELDNCPNISKDDMKKLYLKYKNMSDFEYYQEISQGCIFKDDELDAYSIQNPNAKYEHYSLGDKFSLPFTLLDGTTSYQAKMKDIDWPKIHLYNTFPYERAWEMIVEHDSPNNEDESHIYENMKCHVEYFNNFEDKTEYVNHNTSFWTYAILSDKGWEELNNSISDKEWVASYFDKYIKELSEDTLLTIYEYRELY